MNKHHSILEDFTLCMPRSRIQVDHSKRRHTDSQSKRESATWRLASPTEISFLYQLPKLSLQHSAHTCIKCMPPASCGEWSPEWKSQLFAPNRRSVWAQQTTKLQTISNSQMSNYIYITSTYQYFFACIIQCKQKAHWPTPNVLHPFLAETSTPEGQRLTTLAAETLYIHFNWLL